MLAGLEQSTLLGRHQAKQGVRPVRVVGVPRERLDQLSAVGSVFSSKPDARPSTCACIGPIDGGVEGFARFVGAAHQLASDSVNLIAPAGIKSGPPGPDEQIGLVR